MQVSSSSFHKFWNVLLVHHKLLKNSDLLRATQKAAENLIGIVIA